MESIRKMRLADLYCTFLLLSILCISSAFNVSPSPLCTDDSIRLKPCANNDTYCGDWKDRVYIPNNCRYREISNEDGRKCLANKTIACIGDSMIRDMCIGLAMYLLGEKVEDGFDYKYDKISTHFTNATKIGHFKSWVINNNNLLFPKVENRQTNSWQVQVWQLPTNRSLLDHHIEDVLHNKMSLENSLLRHLDFAFWGYGLHDYEAWDSHPYGQRYFDSVVKQYIRIRQNVPTPVVWTSINPHCPIDKHGYILKERGDFKLQMHMAHEGNYVTNKLLREKGLPYYDSAGPMRTPQICNVSSDGIHAKMWLDLVRAQIMLNHLCDENNNWIGDPNRF